MHRSTSVILSGFACVCVFALGAHAEVDGALLDEIILHLQTGREALSSYRCEYTYQESRPAFTPPGGSPETPMDFQTTGAFVIDRTTGKFRDVKESMYSWSGTEQRWMFSKQHSADDGGKEVQLQEAWKDTQSWPVGVYRPMSEKLPRKAGYSGPEQFFSRYGASFDGDYLEQYRPHISDLVRVDDYRYKVVMQAADAELAGYWEEYIVDSRYGWNIVSEKGYAPSGELRYEQSMDFERVGGMLFLVHASLQEYGDKNNPAPTRSVDLTVDKGSVMINPVLTDSDFRIQFPPGTHVQDEVRHFTYRIPDDQPSASFESEPVIAMAADSFVPEPSNGGLSASEDNAEAVAGTNPRETLIHVNPGATSTTRLLVLSAMVLIVVFVAGWTRSLYMARKG